MNRHRTHGFTLLELLIALSIFALVAAMAYGGLNTMLRTTDGMEARAEALRSLQMAWLWLERDIEGYVDRPVRNEYGDSAPALRLATPDGLLIEFTRGGWNNPLGQARSTLQRVAYRLEDGILYRRWWTVLDRAQDSAPVEEPLLEGVDEVRIRVLDEQRRWQEQWPPLDRDPEAPPPRPLAVELRLETGGFGELRWLFRLAG